MSFFDLQVNGYAGIDFNGGSLTTAQVREACVALKEDGTEGVLATVITDGMESMKGKLQRLVKARDEDELVREVIVGLHIEGPCINERDGYVGAHPRNCVVPASVEGMKELLEAAGGLTRLVTLAPEREPLASVSIVAVGRPLPFAPIMPASEVRSGAKTTSSPA